MGVELDTADTDELDAAELAVGSMVYVEAETDGETATLLGGYASDEVFVAGVTQVMVKGTALNRATIGQASVAAAKIDYTAALALQSLRAQKGTVAFFGVMFDLGAEMHATDLQLFD
ncbi:MAG: hypothetical protein AAFX44_03600 [Pseudomonadota bacterium]